MTAAGGRARAVPHVAAVASLLAALSLSACHQAPPQVVPAPPSAARTATLAATINSILTAPAVSRGTWGIVVRSLARSETLFALNDHKLMMPASTQKVVTLAVAADQLGWDYSYRTSVFAVGKIDDGVLKGDLLIVGSGDPTTFDDWQGQASSRFREWAAVLKRVGIRKVDGRIIGDDNAFDDDGLGTGWAWDDLAASYATAVGALQYNENTAQLVITPAADGEPARVQVRPESARLNIFNHTTTGTGAPLTVRPLPHSATIEIAGAIGPSSERVLRNVSVPNPTVYFVNAVRDGLIRNGVDVIGPAVDIDDLPEPLDRANAVICVESFSDGITALSETMMKLSQNLFAETLLKTLGLKASGTGSAAAGRAVVDATLANWGVAAGEVIEVDGSGLSRYNVLTPDALAIVLGHVYRDDRLRDRFIATLPRAAVDGTLGERMKGTPAADNLRAKTGSFTNARSVAGFVRTADGEPLAVVIMANHYGAPSKIIDDATDAILVALASFSRR